MKVQIMVVTYLGDREWLVYCLRSIQKFATGFAGTVVVVPEDEHSQFTSIVRQEENTPFELRTYQRSNDKRLWHLDHQRIKCYADMKCPNADLILHTDSDCIFTEPVTPDEYIHDGKPVLLVESFKRIGSSNWKATTDRALGIDSKWETMRRHPAVHYHQLYPETRALVSKRNSKPFDQYVLSCKPDFPWGFSEFNVLGNVVMENASWKSRYRIIDIGVEPRPKDKLLQFWSHWGLDGKITDRGPYFGQSPRRVIQSIFDRANAK